MDLSSILYASSICTNNSTSSKNKINLCDQADANDLSHVINFSHEIRVKLDNVDLNLVNYLNKELNELGLDSIYPENDNSKANYNLIFKNSIDIVKRFKRLTSNFDKIQEEYYKVDKENELIYRRQQTLKETQEAVNRELAECEEKFRQSQLKISSLTKSVKELTEENKKCLNTIEQRDKQFKHERKKLEKEIEKLKERVQILSTGKTKELPHIDISESIYRRSSNGARPTWNTDSSKKQIELYTELVKDYDRKNKELIIENADVKNFMSHIYKSLCSTMANFSQDLDSSQNESILNQICDSMEHMPFDEQFHSNFNKKFQEKFKLISEILTSNIQQKTSNNNVSMISTIDSTNSIQGDDYDRPSFTAMRKCESKNMSVANNELNTTFTVEDNDHNEHQEVSILKKKLNEVCIELAQSKKVIETQSNFIDSFTNLKNLNSFMNESKKEDNQTHVKERLSSSSVSLSSSSSENEQVKMADRKDLDSKRRSNARNFNSNKDTNEINEEDLDDITNNRLQQEKRIFLEQKLKLEQDACKLRKNRDELAKKQTAFQQEQESFYQSKLFSSFSMKSNSTNLGLDSGSSPTSLITNRQATNKWPQQMK